MKYLFNIAIQSVNDKINSSIYIDFEETLQKELEKIDQESRVARRAFENRITKHITIQVRNHK